MPSAMLLRVVLGFPAASAAAQQWTAVTLHPAGYWRSEVRAVNAAHQGGDSYTGTSPTEAGLWAGTPSSWLRLSPPEASGRVSGMDGPYQVGTVFSRAALWHGTLESRIDLHPVAANFSSIALAVRGNMQVGGTYDGQSRAALWRGTAASYVNLHPVGAIRSTAYATDGVLQGGQVDSSYAALWNGTPQSFINMNPSWAVLSSIRGMAPGVQVGWIQAGAGTSSRAALWTGTPESCIDLHPPGVPGSTRFFATTGRIHVGDGGITGLPSAAHALINFGTPNAWLDLHQFLPAHFTTFSSANAVHQDGDRIFVGGWATSALTGQREAILWIGTLSCYANCDESPSPPLLTIADFSCFLQRFAAGDGYANCDRSTTPPVLNVADFSCFLQKFAAGCP
jgi:hypothetical protein